MAKDYGHSVSEIDNILEKAGISSQSLVSAPEMRKAIATAIFKNTQKAIKDISDEVKKYNR